MADRQQLIRLIHVAKRELAMADDSYRAVLRRVGRKESAADLTIPELEKVVEHLKHCGFKVRSKKGARGQAEDEQSKMIRGLWLELADRGVVQNRSEEALAAFVKRMTGVDALDWLSSPQASRVIEHLKKWRDRTTEAV
ncbi:gp16 family protein [Burkholderia stagnalis]|uniref:gp16 family protein n=1 Tax=Burkholderia stagnalis TaxID=1503054 RepID=UPI000F5C5974|nr:regulatory protein GemA [Burkholderia stagnalis]RQY11139.1 regulatory protein GemA [Burkholderia stagnalis]RQY88972.1 regulatory protein GemA [Burkholderia stagnalis]RQY96667.1 regulatory protein GemA [Burkholderia stagnalis]